ncbi:MAG: ATPase [Candidatus Margulisiibacteriota bacterium]
MQKHLYMKKNSIVLFNQKQIRRFYDEDKETWLFSIIDVVEILTGSSIPKRYWSDLKKKLKNEGSEVYEKIVHLKMLAPDGKQRETDCFSTEASTSEISKKQKPDGLEENNQE